MLQLPPILHHACDKAYTFMIHNRNHELYPYYRFIIYQALRSEAGTQIHRVRLTLSLHVVRYVLPIWHAERPTNPWPEQIIALTEAVLQGTLPHEVVENMVKDTDFITSTHPWESFDQPNASPLSRAARYVAETVGELPFEATGAYRFDNGAVESDYPNHLSDAQDTDPWGADLVLWAMCAYTNSSWSEQANPEKRRAFWTWWLKEAIPTAWNMAHTLSP